MPRVGVLRLNFQNLDILLGEGTGWVVGLGLWSFSDLAAMRAWSYGSRRAIRAFEGELYRDI